MGLGDVGSFGGDVCIGMVVGADTRAVGAHGSRDDFKRSRNPLEGRLIRSLARGRIGQLVDAVVVVICGEEYDVGDVVVGDKFQNVIAFGPVAADPGFAAVLDRGE